MFTTSGRTITFPGFLRAYVEDTDERTTDAEQKDDAEKRLPQLARGDALDAREFEAERAHHLAAGALHRAVAGQGAGGAGRRPAVDLRLDHADDPGPRLRVEEGRRARAVLDRVRGGRPARVATSPGWSTTASPPRSRTTSTTIAAGERSRVDWLQPVLLRRRRTPRDAATHLRAGRAEAADRRPAGGDRRPRRQLDPARRTTGVVVRVGRYGPYLQRGEGDSASAPRSRRTSPRTS